MGNCLAKLCTECLLGENTIVEYQMISMTDSPGVVADASVDSEVVLSSYEMSLKEAEEEFIGHLQEDVSSMEILSSKDEITVRTKSAEKGFFLHSTWSLNHDARSFLDFYYKTEERLKWDKNIKSIETNTTDTEGINLTYSVFKKVPFVSQRDLVIVSKEMPHDQGILLVSCSVDTDQYPPDEGNTRMFLFVGGYYIRNTHEQKCIVTSITRCDFGGNIPASLVKKLTASNMSNFVKSISKALDKHYAS